MGGGTQEERMSSKQKKAVERGWGGWGGVGGGGGDMVERRGQDPA